MRTPSRRMPKFVPRPVTWAGWLVQIGIIAAIVGLIWSAPKVLWFVPIAVVCLVFEISRRKRRLKALAAARPGESICNFAREFDFRETDTWIIRAVYEQLQAHLADDALAFPLRREDHLTKTLGIDPDDLSYDLADEIAAALEGAVPSVAGHRLVNLRLVFWTVTRGRGGEGYGASLRIRAATEPL